MVYAVVFLRETMKLISARRLGAMAAAIIGFSASQARAAETIAWTDWTSGTASPTAGVAAGTLAIGATTMNVAYAGELYVIQFNGGGTNYWSPLSTPYTGAIVANAPPGTDIIELNQLTSKRITFSRPVRNPLMAIVSLNANGYTFDQDFTILSGNNAPGFWGTGTAVRTTPAAGQYRVTGTGEFHGVVMFTGVVSQINFTSTVAETWNGFTVGIRGFACTSHKGTGATLAGTDCPYIDTPVCASSGLCVDGVANGQPMPVNPSGLAPYDGTCRAADAANVCASGVCSTTDNKCGLANGEVAKNAGGVATTNALVCRSNFIAADGLCGQPNSDPTTATVNACVSPNPPPAVTVQCRSGVCFSTAGAVNPADNQCGKPNNEPCAVNGDCRTVCVGADHVCGLLNGTPCTNAASCRSAVCNADGACGDPNGTACTTGGTCRGGACVSGVCAASCSTDTQCASAAYCNAGTESCVTDEPNGSKTGAPGNKNTICDRAGQCASGVCNADGSCGDPDATLCATGTTCRSGVCTAGRCGLGCATDAECGNGRYCEDTTHVCIVAEPNGSKVGPVGAKNTNCTIGRAAAECTSAVCNADGRCGNPDGVACATGVTCRSGGCTPTTKVCTSVCTPGGAVGDQQCAPAFFCSGAAANVMGVCMADAADGTKPNGLDCNRSGQCASNVCGVGGACGTPPGCATDADCTSQNFCSGGMCAPKRANSDACTAGNQCVSALCHPDGKCGAPVGDSCGSAVLCRSMLCDATRLKCAACNDDSQCGGAGRVCSAVSGTCIDGCRGSGGNGCAAGSSCTSGDATIGTCVSTGSSSGSVGSSGTAGTAGTAGGSSGTPPGAVNGAGLEGGGIACGLGGTSANGGLMLALGIAAAAVAQRRRRLSNQQR